MKKNLEIEECVFYKGTFYPEVGFMETEESQTNTKKVEEFEKHLDTNKPRPGTFFKVEV